MLVPCAVVTGWRRRWVSLAALRASLQLFTEAVRGVIRSPIAFYDTTPLGAWGAVLARGVRVVDGLRCRKDTLAAVEGPGRHGQPDRECVLSGAPGPPRALPSRRGRCVLQLLSTFSSILGTVALIFYTFPLLGIIFAPLSVLYWACATFYRCVPALRPAPALRTHVVAVCSRSSVEAKRLDSVLRSALYSSYSGAHVPGREMGAADAPRRRNADWALYGARVSGTGTMPLHLTLSAAERRRR